MHTISRHRFVNYGLYFITQHIYRKMKRRSEGMEFKESNTYNNLKKAMDAEMRTSTKYRMYADRALQEKMRPVAKIFEELSGNEKEHAVLWNGILNSGNVPNTEQNLKSAASGEQYEWTRMYEDYANTAAEEGYNDIADMFRRVALIEHHHDIILRDLIKRMDSDGLFCDAEETIWICTNCGYLYYGKCAPDKCPVCGYPVQYYEKLQENCNNTGQ